MLTFAARVHSAVKILVDAKLPLGVVIVTGPVVAPVGTSAKTPWLEATAKCVAGVPLKLTPVVVSKLAPQSRTHLPGASEEGSIRPMCGLGAGRPRSQEKSVPSWYSPKFVAPP